MKDLLGSSHLSWDTNNIKLTNNQHTTTKATYDYKKSHDQSGFSYKK